LFDQMTRALLVSQVSSAEATKARRIAATLRRAIASGQVQRGELLPSTREVARDQSVHRHTVLRAMGMLAAEGWVEVEPRRGFRVAVALPQDGQGKARGARQVHLARDAGLDPLPDAAVKLGHAGPDVRLFPADELRGAYGFVLRTLSAQAMGEAPIEGHPRLVAALSTYFRRVRGVTGRAVAITSGAQDAIASIAQLLVAPGDRVAVEIPGYPPAWEAFRVAGATLVGVPVDGQGLSVEALERELRRGPIRALYTTPHHQYPSTVTLAIERRAALLAAAARARVTIIEDDYDHEYHYASAPIAPLASAANADHVIYVTTLTKALFPSARVAAVASSEALHRSFLRLRRALARVPDALAQLALAVWIEEGGLERHLRRTCRIYQRRRDAMVEALRAPGLRRFVELEVPRGGLALWIRATGRSATAIARDTLKRGVLVFPEAALRLAPGDDAHLRLGFAALSPDEASSAIAVLRVALAG
jgi:GntR family transcriptional regulator/MocR family aminotransferase